MPRPKKAPAAAPAHDHSAAVPRIRRIQGQVEGVGRMLEEGRYCIDVIHQIRAARSALLSLENSILRHHLHTCVHEAMHSRSAADAARKIEEITDLLGT